MSKSSDNPERHHAWQENLITDGFCLLRAIVPPQLVLAARTAIEEDLAFSYDPARQLEYDHRSYCPGIREAPAIRNLLFNERVKSSVDAVIAFDRLLAGPPQIAIRRARTAAGKSPPEPHIDGLATAHNHVSDESLQTFSLLVGVFLTAVTADYSGNLTVWPGSHHEMERHFRARGPRAMHEGQPDIRLNAPRQLLAMPGDVVLCHYCLAHGAAANTSPHDRIAVYFRLTLDDLHEHRWHRLANIWDGWRLTRRDSC